METIGDARAFLSAAREVALTKPIIVIKPGRTAGRRQGRRLAHRLADRQRRCARSRLPALRRAAREQHRRPVLHGRSAGQAAAPEGPAPDHRDQRRRPGRAGHRCADHQRRRAGRALARDDGGAQRAAARGLEPQQPGRHPRRRQPRALRQGARDRRQGPEQRRHAGHPHAAGHDRPDPDRRGAQAATPNPPASRCWPAGWAARTWRRARPSSTAPTSPPSPIPTPRRASSTTCGSTPTTCAALRDARPSPTPQDDRSRIAQGREPIIDRGRARRAAPSSPSPSPSSCWPPTASRPSRPRIAATEDEAVKAAEEIGYPGRAQAPLRDHHAQDRRGRRAAEPRGRGGRAPGLQPHPRRRSPRRPAPSTSRASPCSR